MRLAIFLACLFGCINLALADANTDREYMEKLATLRDGGQWNLAVIYAQEWTRKDAQSAMAWNQLALSYDKMGQYPEALTAVRRAVQLANQNPILWSNMGYAHLRLNEPTAALKAFQESARWDPKNPRTLTEIGWIYLKAERDKEAKYNFDGALEANPEYAGALCGEGFVAYRARRMKDVKEYVQQLTTRDRECADGLEARLANDARNDNGGPDFDTFWHPLSARAKAAFKRFSNDIAGRCATPGSSMDCIHERKALEEQFYNAVRNGRIAL